MDIRDRILAAARRVYAQHGFRGATTRLIAIEAGVNEVTLFRTFGSKAALFQQVSQTVLQDSDIARLPETPDDPERELTEWCASTLAYMRDRRSIIRKSIGDLEERPDAAMTACQGPNCAGEMLLAYADGLREQGLADPDADTYTAVAMLMSALFGDAMCREMMPDGFPQPVEDAPAKYVRTFMRAIGATSASSRALPRARGRSAMTRGRRSAS
jgi:AcrR family transcriptional regulator